MLCQTFGPYQLPQSPHLTLLEKMLTELLQFRPLVRVVISVCTISKVSHCDDKEVLITIQKAVDASPELRSKKALIETFIAGINDVSDVMLEWRTFVAEEKERQLAAIIDEENLKNDETRRFMGIAFRDGSVKTTGMDIDRMMPPISRFGSSNRAAKKQTVIEKLQAFFERFFGIG